MRRNLDLARAILLAVEADDFRPGLPLCIDAARNETIWNAAREKFMDSAAGVAFDVVLDWMKQQARNYLGLD